MTTAWNDFASRASYEPNWYLKLKHLCHALFNMLNYKLVETNPFDPY
uniref:Uncharacterized protein n=1 Tax=Romanomermis culicivorax TaxID=13658 RepID=A0A915L014_ROMCU